MCFEVKGGMNADLYLWAMTSKLWCKLLYRTFKKQCWGEVTTGEKLILLSKSFLERSFLENIHQWSWSSVIRPNENICLVGTCRVRWLSLEHSRWIRSTDQTTSFPSFPFQFFFLTYFFNWKIIALQNFIVFCQISTWISHRYTYIPSLLNLPPISCPIPPL